MEKASFEAACALAFSYVTAEKLRERGVKSCMDDCRAALAAIGWTHTGLVEESGRRMRESIAAAEEEDGFDRCIRCQSTDVDCHPSMPNFVQTYECGQCGKVMERNLVGKLVERVDLG